MFPDDMTDERKLSKARDEFERALDYYEEFTTECRKAFEFYDGHQWDPSDLDILREDNRPALTFNVVKARVRHQVGAHADTRQQPTLEPVGPEDQFSADVLNHILTRLRRKGNEGPRSRRVFKDGCICGKGDMNLDVYPDPNHPTWVKMDYGRIDPLEVKWDPAAKEFDRGDARYMFWDKWMAREDFKIEYPDFADDIDEIMQKAEDHGTNRFGYGLAGQQPRGDKEGYVRIGDLKYYDRRRDLVRLIHMEYKRAVKRVFVVNPESGRIREVDPEISAPLQDIFEAIEIVEIWDEEYRWLEFIGDTILFDGESENPYTGWSVDSFYYDVDYNSGLPVGMVRDLIDPQQEVNKRHSQMLNMITSQTQPGTFAETTAVVDQDAFEDSLGMNGSTTWLNPGGLERVKDRTVPQFPDSVARLFEMSMSLIEVISGVFTDELSSPRGIPEAAATAQLKHRKSQLTQIDPVENFDDFQRSRARKEVETIINAMPDDQIAHLLGNSDKYEVVDDEVRDIEHGFTMPLSAMRDIEYDVELQMSDANQSQRLLELSTLGELQAKGVPIDPEVIFALTTLSADNKAKLVKYQQGQIAAASEKDSASSDFTREQIELRGKTEEQAGLVKAMSAMEQARHNLATEHGSLEDSKRDHILGLLGIYEKADTSEKQIIMKFIEGMTRRQNQRAIPAQVGA